MWNGKKVVTKSLFWVSLVALIVGVGLVACGGGGSTSVSAIPGGPGGPGSPPVVVIPPPPPLAASCTATSGAITLSAGAARATGVGPLAVFFDATATTSTATASPFHEIEYRWDFGDPGGNWAQGRAGSSKNLATGPVAAHVFETPNTYTITITAFDGTSTATCQVQVTVDDPDVVFAGTNTICFANTAIGAGCPPGALPVTGSNDFATVVALAATGKRLLLQRGDIWTAATPASLAVNGPGIIGAFGAGARPLIQLAGGTRFLRISSGNTPDLADWRVMDLEFDGQGVPGATSAAIDGLGGMNQLTLLRLNIHDVGVGINFSFSSLDVANSSPSATPGHDIWNELAIVDSTVERTLTSTGGNGMFLSASRLMVLGNLVNDTTAGEHNIRSQYAAQAVFGNNTAGVMAVTKHALTIRAPIIGSGGVTGGGPSRQVIVADNNFIGGLGDITVNLGNVSPAGVDARVQDVIVERNLFLSGAATLQALSIFIDDVTVRNNICSMTSGPGSRCIVIGFQDGSEPSHRRAYVYNNSGYGGIAAFFRLVRLQAGVDQVKVFNNIAYAPISGNAGLLEDLGATNLTVGGNTANASVAITSPLYSNGSTTFTSATDFTLAPGSYAINTFGVAAPVFSDFFRNARPVGGIDSGATEQ